MCLIRPVPPDPHARRELADGLVVSRSTEHLEVHLPTGGTAVQFARAAEGVRVRFRYAGGKVTVDVSFQPGAVDRELEVTARECGADPNRWRLAVLGEIREWSNALSWCPQHHEQLLAAVGALAFPLLREVYQRGHRASGELPRWALPVLRCHDAAQAAAALEPRATRRTARALAGSLVVRPAPAEIELAPLAYATAAAGLVSVDELANLLETAPPDQPGAVPDGEQVDELRRGVQLYPPARRGALLLDAVRTTHPTDMAQLMRQLWWVRDKIDHTLPVRVRDLVEVCARLVPVIAPDAPRPARTLSTVAGPRALGNPGHRREFSGADEPPDDALRQLSNDIRRRIQQARPAPAGLPVGVDVTRWPIPQPLLQLHDFRRGRLHLVVPTSKVELQQWARRLHNCLADYAPAMAIGRCWLVGVELDERLIGCVEVRPRQRTIRQATGMLNQALPCEVLDEVVAALTSHGVINRA